MSLTEDERNEVIRLKLEKSNKAFEAMQRCFEQGLFSTAANRLYYSLFYASSALLVYAGYEAHTHSGNLSLINRYFIKTNIIPSEYGKLLRVVFRLRQDSDYDDYFSVTEDDIKDLISPTQEYIDKVKQLIGI